MMGFNIVGTGYCNGCERAELEFESLSMPTFSLNKRNDIYSISCIHEDICQMWRTRLEKIAAEKEI